jgi:shikimate kinase
MPELPQRIRRIVLIGLMGAGKTTVGRILAERLGWTFIDLDEAIAAHAGMNVPRIFAERGEQAFRSLEQQLTRQLASSDRVVFAPGGGWITSPGAIAEVPDDSAIFWLQVSPVEAVRRVQIEGFERPLLARATDPVHAAGELAQAREQKYAAHGLPIQTEQRTPADVATEILNKLGDRHQQ